MPKESLEKRGGGRQRRRRKGAHHTTSPNPRKTVKYGRKSWGGESERVRRMRGKRQRGEWVKKKKKSKSATEGGRGVDGEEAELGSQREGERAREGGERRLAS